MAIILTSDQQALTELVKNFMENEVKPHIKEYDRTGEFPLELYKKGFELGFHLLNIPEEHGGLGLDLRTMSIVLEEMAKVEPAFAITNFTSIETFECILLSGTKEQIARYSAKLLPGALGAFSLTEPNAGSDSASLRMTAVRDGDDYILNGRKTFITNGGYSDIYIIFATVDRSLGAKGITAFIVEKGIPGFTVGKHEDKMGMRLSNTTDLVFDNVRVSAADRLGEEGEGFKIAMMGLDAGKICHAAVAVGIAQGAIDEAVKYAKERVQFGKPIIKNQAIQFMLADMDMQTEAARQLTYNGGLLLDSKEKAIKEAAMAKCFASDTAVKVTQDAVQIFGGYGYSREYPVEKMYRDAKITQIWEGTNQIQRIVISRELIGK
ncbi:acyl-CoA dehydrogenase [Desulfosporosinus fructosivorans]|uniref:Acyl-CoA dehydrogenase n=1 Tax=Desulfosporosinus fructosivorans TaxID=2018669 RepID=A0A4Z0RCC8_9FIRM|nr:acyl-CoA dehydrogenase family protein [Desulfosporosinus fructosivorans]TGE39276.1 acyl-CoA dehydrogenase [Desulfosporosinus fructosivorans]